MRVQNDTMRAGGEGCDTTLGMGNDGFILCRPNEDIILRTIGLPRRATAGEVRPC